MILTPVLSKLNSQMWNKLSKDLFLVFSKTPDCSEITLLGLSNKRNPVQFPGFKLIIGWQFIFLATPGDEYFEKLLCRSSRMFDNLDKGGLGGLVQQMNHIMDGVTSIQQPTL